jgi:hypothetical protein
MRPKESSKGQQQNIKDGLWTIPAKRMKVKIEFILPPTPLPLAHLGDANRFLFSADGGADADKRTLQGARIDDPREAR